ncbi:pre-60S factor rei1 [Sorochytrium milnesiophthora]
MDAHNFTCFACQVAFAKADQQRDHYRTEWHRYNLKRKVAELPPVTAQVFAERMLSRQTDETATEERAQLAYSCAVCSKIYSSENAYNNHVNSKKHKETAAKKKTAANDAAVVVKRKTQEEREGEAADQDELIEKRIKNSVRLELTDCLFCTSKFASLEDNLSHMTVQHSFFIPDIDYLADLPGLLSYLGEKLSVGHACLWCHSPHRKANATHSEKNQKLELEQATTRGLFNSLQDVRRHMADKGHCKIAYEDDADLEVADFYDFSSTWPDQHDASSESGQETGGELARLRDDALVSGEHGIEIEPLTSELILPSGKSLGHRSLARYYRQHIRPEATSDAVIINQLANQYKQLGYQSKRVLPTDIKRAEQAFDRRRAHWEMELGTKSNKLQRYFREQVLY